MARELATDAIANGATVTTEKLDKPFVIGGVGNGTQSCHFRLNIDLAVPTTNGSATTFNWKPPIVEGTGSGLPGLLGLNSLEENRAIIDVGNKKMIYPGPGEVTYNLPPGSIEMPLQKNSHGGRLCLTVNEYAKAKLAQAANNTIVQPTRHLPIIEQPELTSLDVPSGSATRGGPVSGTLTGRPITSARRKGTVFW